MTVACSVRMDERHERYAIPDADVLFEDVWAEDEKGLGAVCASCGAPMTPSSITCAACGTPAAVCTGSCSSCGSPVCVGEKRRR